MSNLKLKLFLPQKKLMISHVTIGKSAGGLSYPLAGFDAFAPCSSQGKDMNNDGVLGVFVGICDDGLSNAGEGVHNGLVFQRGNIENQGDTIWGRFRPAGFSPQVGFSSQPTQTKTCT